MYPPEITLSIVSHGQGDLVNKLLADIDSSNHIRLKEVIVTSNIPEEFSFKCKAAPLKIIVNKTPKGFGENHNAAFQHSSTSYFCIANPDIQFRREPWTKLLEFIKSGSFGAVGPKVVNLFGNVEDSARPFPTFFNLLMKLAGIKSAVLYHETNITSCPDWVAGMFILFNSEAFEAVGGFDERYFLYYEDADICMRLRGAGWEIGYCRDAEVIHDARRDSHRNLRYLKWHLISMLRFFMSSAYRRCKNK